MKTNTIVITSLLAISFACGWWFNGLRHDSISLAAERAATRVLNAERERESKIAESVEKRLQELKANEQIIHTFEREVIERPVYRVECIDADGLLIINDYATGNTTEPAR